tara:strand:- start:60 stop:311 length:252 start_codon:yes stop_codon:yes gene_type:complete
MSDTEYSPEPEPAPAPAPAPVKKKRQGKPMTDKQKADLTKHMKQHKDLKDLSSSELKSHRMKMMVRMRKGMSIAQAHKDIKGK